jgi:LEA14-like dessication related protein
VVFVSVVCSGLAGCGALDAFNKPSADIVGVRLKDIDLRSATLVFDIKIGNPYSVPLPLANIDYSLASEGTGFVSGKSAMQGTVPAAGSKTVPLPLKVEFLELLKVLKGVRLGSVVPYDAEMGLSVDAPVVGPMRLPLKKRGKLPIPAPPGVKITNIRWDKLTLDQAGGRAQLQLTNRNAFPVTLSRLKYALSLAGTEVANSALAKSVAFGADGGTGTVDIPVSFSPKSLGLAVFRMLMGKGSGYDLSGDMNADTDFGPMSLPLKGIGKTLFSRGG